jgi:hypothetical protein
MNEGQAFFEIMPLDMIMGMALGMIASPLMMKAIKVFRRRRKIDRLLKEIAKTRMTDEIGPDAVPGGVSF